MATTPNSQGLFAFSFSVFALFTTLLACGAVLCRDAYSAFSATILATAAAVGVSTLWPNNRAKAAIHEYYEQHRCLIEEAEALNSKNSAGTKPESETQVACSECHLSLAFF